MHLLCRIDKAIYSLVEREIQSLDVVITDERIEHIKERHPQDYERFMRYIPQIIQEPDYIIASSKPHTAVILKMIEENGERFKAILRLKVEKDPSHYSHSIISFWRIGDATWKKILRNKVILYRRE
ncbi:PBECR2 nuclease fold domain-containing protein [uncultured Selenomonas sp.]|uniref:PBECR2 nuclease fold domain-containing protein n=1 Tax=uncultured Selenomonas sp. TaxID=159275 RepID=UPI0028D056B4|nr:PBECR2 nuclease fold domain-containing protein [uncultured Selenomonas sp.]